MVVHEDDRVIVGLLVTVVELGVVPRRALLTAGDGRVVGLLHEGAVLSDGDRAHRGVEGVEVDALFLGAVHEHALLHEVQHQGCGDVARVALLAHLVDEPEREAIADPGTEDALTYEDRRCAVLVGHVGVQAALLSVDDLLLELLDGVADLCDVRTGLHLVLLPLGAEDVPARVDRHGGGLEHGVALLELDLLEVGLEGDGQALTGLHVELRELVGVADALRAERRLHELVEVHRGGGDDLLRGLCGLLCCHFVDLLDSEACVDVEVLEMFCCVETFSGHGTPRMSCWSRLTAGPSSKARSSLRTSPLVGGSSPYFS